eukprot:scaffold31413_cov52-Phaeocystis_antarctica.AAC.2
MVGQTIRLHVGCGEQLDSHHFTILVAEVDGCGGQGRRRVRIGGSRRGGEDVHSDGVSLLHTKAEVAASRRAVDTPCIFPVGGVRCIEEPNHSCGVRPDGRVDHAHAVTCKSARGHDADHFRLGDGVAHRIACYVHALGVRASLRVPPLPFAAHIDSQLALDVVLHLPHAVVREVPEQERVCEGLGLGLGLGLELGLGQGQG